MPRRDGEVYNILWCDCRMSCVLCVRRALCLLRSASVGHNGKLIVARSHVHILHNARKQLRWLCRESQSEKKEQRDNINEAQCLHSRYIACALGESHVADDKVSADGVGGN